MTFGCASTRGSKKPLASASGKAWHHREGACAARRSPLRPAAVVENRGFVSPPMPKVAQSPLLCAFCCFPPASPTLRCGTGKHKAAQNGRFMLLISLRKIGAGEGIRTPDPNLGQVAATHVRRYLS